MINIIVAYDKNLAIGKDNTLVWRQSADLKRFKELTTGHTVVMGRKCWESIPEKYRPLPNRKNIVLSRNKDYVAKGAIVINDLERILSSNENNLEQIFIIGGAELYKEAFKYANKLFLTQIFQDVDGDIILEGLNSKDWCLYEGSEIYEENGFKFRFELYQKNDKKDCF
jgi:dihydrofolate reductase